MGSTSQAASSKATFIGQRDVLRNSGDADDSNSASGSVPSSLRATASSAESRLEERLGSLLSQKKTPDAVMVGVLVAALILGLIGLAAHVLWIVAIVVMALGLGFVLANSRRDRIDIVNEHAAGRSQTRSSGSGSAEDRQQPVSSQL